MKELQRFLEGMNRLIGKSILLDEVGKHKVPGTKTILTIHYNL